MNETVAIVFLVLLAASTLAVPPLMYWHGRRRLRRQLHASDLSVVTDNATGKATLYWQNIKGEYPRLRDAPGEPAVGIVGNLSYTLDHSGRRLFLLDKDTGYTPYKWVGGEIQRPNHMDVGEVIDDVYMGIAMDHLDGSNAIPLWLRIAAVVGTVCALGAAIISGIGLGV